jgi:hypothetical protein
MGDSVSVSVTQSGYAGEFVVTGIDTTIATVNRVDANDYTVTGVAQGKTNATFTGAGGQSAILKINVHP